MIDGSPTQPPISLPANWEQILRSVLADVVTINMVKPIVVDEVRRQSEFWDLKISGIDSDQRNSFRDFMDAARELRASNLTVQTAMTQVSAEIARLSSNSTSQDQDIKEIKERLEKLEVQQSNTKSAIQNIQNVQSDLHTDIHGNAADSLRPSIHSMLKEISGKFDTRFGGIETDIKEIKATQLRHDTFINRQQMIINIIWGQAKTLWANKFWRWSLYAFGLTTVSILGANTPPGIDFLTRLIHALGGK